ncbi:MAG: glycosyltransferase N-terminal domain-containing protein [Flavobacteriaceae bacterium]|nr:glycosyltransferase N-terminal domain-containing protein [Flavobacteriaceae bacterium]
MSILYNLFINCVSVLLKLIAPFHPKLKLSVNGHRQTSTILKEKIKPQDRVIWFHCASLGEFEQGRPVIEKAKQLYPAHKIVISFFSPSGYEIRKNYELADAVVYLPFDTNKKVQEFIELMHPEIAVFVKYEFWPNLLNQLNKKNIPTILISGIFRKNQLFFKIYGSWMRNKLCLFSHFFVQDKNSKELLNSIGFDKVTLSGDTRFDRVFEIVNQNNTLDFLENFKDHKYTLVAGSTWPDDEKLLVDYINNQSTLDEKFIIAPHHINATAIQKLQKDILTKSVLFSNYQQNELKNAQVFIVDTIGILTKVYSYADVAYVGGGFTNGIHNILEPATFGVPIVIGPKHQKFKEAIDLLNLNGCLAVCNKNEFDKTFLELRNSKIRKEMGQKASNYIKSNIGATDLIIGYMINVIKN